MAGERGRNGKRKNEKSQKNRTVFARERYKVILPEYGVEDDEVVETFNAHIRRGAVWRVNEDCERQRGLSPGRRSPCAVRQFKE